jgi:hypothetical protein
MFFAIEFKSLNRTTHYSSQIMLRLIMLITATSVALFGVRAQFSSHAQKANWGMTLQDVIDSESPLIPKVKGSELEFSEVDIGNGLKATLIYRFSNGRLYELKFIVYGKQTPSTRGTCDTIIPLTMKVQQTRFIYDWLRINGYDCFVGWYIPNADHLAIQQKFGNLSWRCLMETSVIESVDQMAKAENASRVAVGFMSERSYATFYFNEHQNYLPDNRSKFDLPCNSDFYNTYFWLEMKAR